MAKNEGSIGRVIKALKAATPESTKRKMRRTLIEPIKPSMTKTRVWLRMRSHDERLKPSFLIIGAMRAGTTSLFYHLAQHPQVARPIVKEIHYFDGHWGRPPAWYFAHFPPVQNLPANAITGEASPGYIFIPGVADTVAKLLPRARVIALLRDPVARAISNFHHSVRAGFEKRSLENAIFAPESSRFPALSEFDPQGRGYLRKGPTHECYIARGLYAAQLALWVDRIVRDRLLVIKSEDLFRDPRSVYDQAVDFLELDRHDPGSLKALNAIEYGRSDGRVAERLREIYAEPNRELYVMLGRDFGW